jgi:protein-tyrosine phosphatase
MLLVLGPSVTLSLHASVATTVRSSVPNLAATAGIPNFRDLGGTALRGGRVIAPNRLLRSATPANASASEVEQLVDVRGLRTILDLRSEHDAGKDEGPCLLLQASSRAPPVQYVSMLEEKMLRSALKRKALRRPGLLLAMLPALALKSTPSRRLQARARLTLDRQLGSVINTLALEDIYWCSRPSTASLPTAQPARHSRTCLRRLIAQHHGTEIKKVIETVSQPAALPALVHCTHGKDRTGVAVAMCLHICGASLEQIAADYSASHEWGCSVEGRAAMDKILPPHLAGRVNIDPW